MDVLHSYDVREIYMHLSRAVITMFNWRRPQGMPYAEPTEEQIWNVIEAHDPHHTATLKDRLSWHQEMLEGRNIYKDSFARSSRMLPYDSELPIGHDPADWVTILKLRHSHDAPLEQITDHLSFGDQEVLQPIEDSAPPAGIVRLLGYRILHHEAKDWNPKSVFGTPLAAVSGYTSWARHHLQTHYRIFKAAGIYQAVYASLFDYSRLPFTWIRGIAEHWDRSTNTCWIGPHEMTVTLQDLQDISGLPIFGTPYEECIPPDHELFKRQATEQHRKGSYVYPSSLHRALAHYQKLFKERRTRRGRRGAITLDLWSESFLRKEICSSHFARLNDPFDIGTQASETSYRRRFEPEKRISSHHILARDIDEELSLVAFIATWLCYFVFPGSSRIFRPSVLLMASLLARGERIALAPTALAYLYHGLSQVSVMTDSRRYEVEAPWHYLHGWIHVHISGGFSCPETPSYFKEHQFPIIMQLSRATAAIDTAQIRTFMFAPSRMTDRFQVIHQSQMHGLSIQNKGSYFVDSLTDRNTALLLSKSEYRGITEYFIGLRPSWLCYRRHESVILEGYNPNRVARQYGFTQATPIYGLPKIPGIADTRSLGKLLLSVRTRAASMAWAFLFRLGTGSRFCTAPTEAYTGVSHLWLLWIRHTYSSFLDLGFRIYSRRLQNLGRARHAPSSRRTSDERDSSQKRYRQPSPIHVDCGPSAYPECSQKRSRVVSPPAVRSPSQKDPSPFEEHMRHTQSNAAEGNMHLASTSESTYMPSPHPNGASTSGTAHIPLLVLNEEPLLEQMENETTLILSSPDFSAVFSNSQSTELASGDHASIIKQTAAVGPDNSILDCESSITGSTWVITDGAPEEASEDLESCVESCSVQRNVFQGRITGLELSQFVSRIRSRSAESHQENSSESLNHIVAALRHLLFNVNAEAPPELSSFCTKANSLLDCAAALGLRAEELLQWESLYRDVEFGLFTIQTTYQDSSSNTLTEAEDIFNTTSEQVAHVREDFKHSLGVLWSYQRRLSRANIELLHISAELRELQWRRQYLLDRRSMIRQAIPTVEEECSQVEAQMSELEHTLSSLEQEQKIAAENLQNIQERQETVAFRAYAASICIREIQDKYL